MLYEYNKKGEYIQKYEDLEDLETQKGYEVSKHENFYIDADDNISFFSRVGRDKARKFLVYAQTDKNFMKEGVEIEKEDNSFVIINMLGDIVGEFTNVNECVKFSKFSHTYIHSKLNHSKNYISKDKEFSNLNTCDGYVFVLNSLLIQVKIVNLLRS